MITVLKGLVEHMQEHMGNFSRKIKIIEKHENEMRKIKDLFKCDFSRLDTAGKKQTCRQVNRNYSN